MSKNHGKIKYFDETTENFENYGVEDNTNESTEKIIQEFDEISTEIDVLFKNIKEYIYEEGLNIGGKLTFTDLYDFITTS